MGPHFINPFDYAYVVVLIVCIALSTIVNHSKARVIIILLGSLLCWFIGLGSFWYEDMQWTQWFENIPHPSQAEIAAYDSDPTAEKSFTLLFGLPLSALIIGFGWAVANSMLWLWRIVRVKT